VDKVLIDAGQLFAQNLIENGDDLFISLHEVSPLIRRSDALGTRRAI
jgi:hypothetical protein